MAEDVDEVWAEEELVPDLTVVAVSAAVGCLEDCEFAVACFDWASELTEASPCLVS